MAHTFTNLLTHVVFSTSGRAPFLDDDMRSDVHTYLGGILRELHAVPIAVGGTADHVHLRNRRSQPRKARPPQRTASEIEGRWSRFVLPQAPKSEAPGAPSFGGLTDIPGPGAPATRASGLRINSACPKALPIRMCIHRIGRRGADTPTNRFHPSGRRAS